MKIANRRGISTGEVFHILNRGVDKRKIFLDERDYFRFIHNLFEFNDTSPAFNLGYFLGRTQSIDLRNQYSERRSRQLIVEILAFCLMPNHFHLLLRQKENGGITKFMRKLSVGYANYFNQKYKRTGTLFQGRYKAVLVNRGTHFIHLPYYIHFNPLDLIMPEWRTGKIKNYQKAIKFLENYRWSSHLDYIGKKNFPSVTQKVSLLRVFRGPKDYSAGGDISDESRYRKTVKNWLKEIDLVKVKKLILE
jgi:putative transposase